MYDLWELLMDGRVVVIFGDKRSAEIALSDRLEYSPDHQWAIRACQHE